MRHLAMLPLIAATCCSANADFECHRSADCDSGWCVGGQCHSNGRDTSDARPPGGRQPATTTSNPIVRGPCSHAASATVGQIVLNELLVNVPAAEEGDANGDGVRDAYEDEFVEIVNVSGSPVDMSGVQILAGGKARFIFEPLCVLPGEAVVVFGGGSVGASVSGSAITSQTRLALSNEGGTVSLATAASEVIDTVTYGSSGPSSLTRTPQVFGSQWVTHTTLATALFSPGRCASGSDFAALCQQVGSPEADADAD